jgi:hypothetical protein
MLRLLDTLKYESAEISAGSFAFDESRIVVGTFSGWAAFALDSLDCLWDAPSVLPKGCDVKGVQLDGDDVIMLGYRRAQSFSSPADWKAQLLAGSIGGTTQPRCELPPGNWRMVRNIQGERVYLYDVSEGQGLRCYDRNGLSWSKASPHVRKLIAVGTRLLCIESEQLIVLESDGSFVNRESLPHLDRYEWTSATLTPVGSLVLGGYNRDSKDYAVALANAGTERVSIVQQPLEDVFATDVIENAAADECCGVDIFHVARIQPLEQNHLLLALGGGGEELGACQGASAVALLRADRLHEAWQTALVDTRDGISGMAVLSDGRLLLDLCGELRLYADPLMQVGAASRPMRL